MQDSWKPLLEGDMADRARTALEDIARAVPAATLYQPGDFPEPTLVAWRATLASGSAGKALLYAYLAFDQEARGTDGLRLDGDPGEIALDLLDRSSEAVAEVPMTDSLYSGFPGIAWVNDHLAGRLFAAGDDAEAANAEVDEALLSVLERDPWPGEYDLINGLVGLGIYALEGLPRPTAARCLERVVERLSGLAERSAEGATWFSPVQSIPVYQREDYPEGLYNLGASHGVAGIVGVLGAACGAGVATGSARPLLDETVRWLLAHRQGPESLCSFSHFFYPGMEPGLSRLAWCYGDLGVAATLLVAARGTGEAAWERTALDIAAHAAERPDDLGRVMDAGLCHGAAGVAHLFNRMARMTGDERLVRAARHWYGRALEFHQPGEGVGGFRSWSSGADGQQDWREDPGFLEGAAGIGLALLGAISPVDPEWDRVLMVSARPRP
ncbi:MAG TPA: lanthionine synthetase C family protein [Thermoanaerobaculia bacterium]|nr:lanthionine synthetase C family protein [Thermoanaerobaculia bacterium]